MRTTGTFDGDPWRRCKHESKYFALSIYYPLADVAVSRVVIVLWPKIINVNQRRPSGCRTTGAALILLLEGPPGQPSVDNAADSCYSESDAKKCK